MAGGQPGKMLAILQCRLKSNRLPGKILHTFFEETILQRMIKIANCVPSVDTVVVAFGGKYGSHLILDIIKNNKANFLVGDEFDVLERFISVLHKFKSKYFLRLTCDNYLTQPSLVELLFQETVKEKSSYGYISPLSHYCGEIINTETFLNFFKNNKPSEKDREHVTWSFRESIDIKKTILNNNYLELDHNNSFTLDTLDDLLLMKDFEKNIPTLRNYNCLNSLKKLEKYSKKINFINF